MSATEIVVSARTRCKAYVFRHCDAEQMDDCARLRHAYFVRCRQWVSESRTHPGLEQDRYDAYALHFGVWDEQGLAAYLRALPATSPTGFMIDHEFASLLSIKQHQNLSREGALELSRLTLRPGMTLRDKPNQRHPIEHLLRSLYIEAKRNGHHHFHIVVEPKWLPVLDRRFGLPFCIIGQQHTFPDGTRTIAATTTLAELEEGMKRHSSAKYAWYQCCEGE